jgi:hypothetical protein
MNWLGRCSDLVSGRAKNSHGEGSNEGSCVMQTNNQPVILWGQVQLRWNFFSSVFNWAHGQISMLIPIFSCTFCPLLDFLTGSMIQAGPICYWEIHGYWHAALYSQSADRYADVVDTAIIKQEWSISAPCVRIAATCMTTTVIAVRSSDACFLKFTNASFSCSDGPNTSCVFLQGRIVSQYWRLILFHS